MSIGARTPAAGPRGSLQKRGLGVLSLGHLSVDLNQGALPAMLPFLVTERGLSYTQASSLVLAATVSSSVAQPLFGHVSDRRSWALLLPGGVLLGGIGLAAAGLAADYLVLLLAVLASGVGVAAYHPEAARYAHYMSGSRQGAGMSLFQVGGNVGWALGPIVVTPAVLVFGLAGTLVLVVPAAIAAVVLAINLDRFTTSRRAAGRPWSPSPPQWAAFARLNGAITFRSFVHYGLLTFVPLYFIGQLGASELGANAVLTLILAAGALGNVIGGYAADRFGNRRVLVVTLAALTPLIGVFVAAGDTPLGLVCVALAGGCTVATYGVVIVLGQEYLPNRIGVAAGFTVGLAIGLGGLAAPALGALADARGLETTIVLLALLPIGGTLFALSLPRAGNAAELR